MDDDVQQLLHLGLEGEHLAGCRVLLALFLAGCIALRHLRSVGCGFSGAGGRPQAWPGCDAMFLKLSVNS
jgi:hypothetical protein